MELILDTCGFLSLVGLSEKPLSPAVLQDLATAERVYISSCSLFEIAIKNKKGNLPILPFGSALELWVTALKTYRLTELSVSAKCFFESTELPDYHSDPFDRIIISEALSRKITVITYDAIFNGYGVKTVA